MVSMDSERRMFKILCSVKCLSFPQTLYLDSWGTCLAWVNVVHPRDTSIISSSALLAILNTNPPAKLQALFKKAAQIPTYFICRSVSFMPREIINLFYHWCSMSMIMLPYLKLPSDGAIFWCGSSVLVSSNFSFFFSLWYCTSADVIRNQLITIDSSDRLLPSAHYKMFLARDAVIKSD